MAKIRKVATVIVREYGDRDYDLECPEFHLTREEGCCAQLSIKLGRSNVLGTGGDIPLVIRRFHEMLDEITDALKDTRLG